MDTLPETARVRLPQALVERIAVKPDGCWIVGYKRQSLRQLVPQTSVAIHVQGKTVLSHRLAYELLVGPIADGLVIDHKCSCPSCCNPDHLEAVTSGVNTGRYHSRRRFDNALLGQQTGRYAGPRTCPSCKREFAGRRPWHRFCSDACRWKMWEQGRLDFQPATAPVPAPAFDGPGHLPSDSPAKFRELDAVLAIMGDGLWRTDEDLAFAISNRIGRRVTTSTAGARRRDLRKARYGSRTVQARPWKGTRTLEYSLRP